MKKNLTPFIFCACIACNDGLMVVPSEPQRIWIDKVTRSDTIITGVNNISIHLILCRKELAIIS